MTRWSRSCWRAVATGPACSSSCTRRTLARPTSRRRRSRTARRSGGTSPALVHEWGEDLVGERGLSSVGAVVGATYPREVGEARRAMPQAMILLPGVGAQGATPADVARAFTSGPSSALVNASRRSSSPFATPTTIGAPPPPGRRRDSRARCGARLAGSGAASAAGRGRRGRCGRGARARRRPHGDGAGARGPRRRVLRAERRRRIRPRRARCRRRRARSRASRS